jgi:geranylgeranyl pyrophosphate synthase
MGLIFEDREKNPILDAATIHFNKNILPVLEKEFGAHPNNPDLLFHSVVAGKRLRPFFCHCAFEIAGGKKTDAINYAAAAMELIHCSSLLIDDELDAKEQRPDRKIETVRNKFTPQESVFMGACLELLYTYNLLVKSTEDLNGRGPEVLNTFSQSYSEGVTKEIDKWKHIENKKILTREQYWNEHIHSSGGLFFRMSGRIGALLGTDDKQKIEKLSMIGYKLGQILQAGDDIKDLKPDMLQGYYSLAVIDYFESLEGVEEALFEKRLHGMLSYQDVDEIYEKMINAGSIQRTLDEIKKGGDEIKKMLDEFPESEAKRNVLGIIEFLSIRMKLV